MSQNELTKIIRRGYSIAINDVLDWVNAQDDIINKDKLCDAMLDKINGKSITEKWVSKEYETTK